MNYRYRWSNCAKIQLATEYFQQCYDTEMNQIQFNATQKSLYRSASSQSSKSYHTRIHVSSTCSVDVFANNKQSLYLTILFISRATVSEHFL